MPKFFVEKNQINNGIVNIKGEDVNHIINVLRNGKGDELRVCDFEDGINYRVEITDHKKDNVECKILEQMESNTESNVHITIFQGLPKFDKMELIIQKATEIGVCNIVPLKMKRCVVKFDGKDLFKKIERWNKIAQIAAKQSMRDTITKVENIKTISDLLEGLEELDEVIVAYEKEKSNTLKKELKQIPKNKEYKIKSPLLGKFNVYNMTAALSVLILMGYDIDKFDFSKLKVDGRMTTINMGQDFSVIVDYAHTPNGYLNLFSLTSTLKSNKTIIVAGSAGERDKTKRPLIWSYAS